MEICPKCESVIRHGQRVRASIIGTFLRDEIDSHIIQVHDEEWVEHEYCYREAWESRFVKWLRRQWRWIRESI